MKIAAFSFALVLAMAVMVVADVTSDLDLEISDGDRLLGRRRRTYLRDLLTTDTPWGYDERYSLFLLLQTRSTTISQLSAFFSTHKQAGNEGPHADSARIEVRYLKSFPEFFDQLKRVHLSAKDPL